MAIITKRHREIGFIPDPDPDDWTHLPLLRTSERGSFTRCRQQWWNGHVRRIGRARRGNALVFGSLIHEALERYYVPGMERGEDPIETFMAAYDRQAEEAGFDFSVQPEDDEWVEARQLGTEMLENYLEEFAERDEYWEVISPELACMVVVLDKKGRPMCRYLMQLDLLIYDHHPKMNRYLFVDHKTAKSLPDPEEKELDEQCGTYWLFGPEYLKANGYLQEDKEVSGFLYNVLRKARADNRPRNEHGQYLNKPTKSDMLRAAKEHPDLDQKALKGKRVPGVEAALREVGIEPTQLGAVSKNQPPSLFKRFPVYADEARREAVLDRIRKQFYEMELTRRGKLGVYKVPMFGGLGACTMCEFYTICTMEENGADTEMLIDLEYEESDPYEQYRDELNIDEEG